ncbi:hypothetical protein HOLleu_25774 [Holothuria leucospilota]|uniref:VWF/SSPO/Zonadhesin-like cysteine-rich domain-containing protein n=1 Tax=Holothuria leucospilota TaxID=206669 RepID=A0A9Q1BTC2_HOLLE|nr:hypothetical protein HOLleu_25774 [Holothuria leucospilota]
MLLHMGECIPDESFCYCIAEEKYALKDPNQYGDSYVTGNEMCNPKKGDGCHDGSAMKKSAESLCNGIINPFETLGLNCNDFFNNEELGEFFSECVTDMCATMLKTDFLCASYKTYADACRLKGGDPGAWWEFVPECGKSWELNSGNIYDIYIVAASLIQ